MERFPIQTEYVNPHYAEYGCYASTLAYIAWRMSKSPCPDASLVEAIIDEAVKEGIVKDNAVSIRSGCEWWRAYVTDPVKYIVLAARFFGVHNIDAIEVYRGVPCEIRAPANASIVEWKTRSGSHFTLGDGHLPGRIIYDPWPGLSRGMVKTYRHWRVSC